MCRDGFLAEENGKNIGFGKMQGFVKLASLI